MSPEEQATFDSTLARALNAERDLVIHSAAQARPWIMPADAIGALASRASRDEKGNLRFASDKKAADGAPIFTDAAGAVEELATSRPHWVKAALTPGTGAPGAEAGARPPVETLTYADLLKPVNTAKLREYVNTKHQELERLRKAHFGE